MELSVGCPVDGVNQHRTPRYHYRRCWCDASLMERQMDFGVRRHEGDCVCANASMTLLR